MMKLICKITKNQSKPSGLTQIFVCVSLECHALRSQLNIRQAGGVGFMKIINDKPY